MSSESSQSITDELVGGLDGKLGQGLLAFVGMDEYFGAQWSHMLSWEDQSIDEHGYD